MGGPGAASAVMRSFSVRDCAVSLGTLALQTSGLVSVIPHELASGMPAFSWKARESGTGSAPPPLTARRSALRSASPRWGSIPRQTVVTAAANVTRHVSIARTRRSGDMTGPGMTRFAPAISAA